MPANSPFDFAITELDPTLLSAPFEVQTSWHVIEGAPSCGKTTLINMLANRGFRTVPESGRLYIEDEIARGRTIAEIHESGPALQRAIVRVKRKMEGGLRASDVAFLDAALPGSLAWYRLFGLNPNEILMDCLHFRYASVFVLDRLPLKLDGLRFEDDSHTGFLDEWIARDFNALGYCVVRVPVLVPEERTAFVLDSLFKRGLI